MPDELVALRVEIKDNVAEVTLLGPGSGNLMGPDFWRELPMVFGELDADPEVRAVVLTGSGEDFSHGLDVPGMMTTWSELMGDGAFAAERTELLNELRRMQDAINSVAACRKPVVAAVAGWCVGGGISLVTACDVRLCSSDAKFSVREVKVAIVPDLGSLQRLSGIVGEGHLRELALTGADIDAYRALRIGLVNDVYTDREAVLAAAHQLADAVAANPPLVVQGVKNVLDASRESQVADGLRYVAAWSAAFLPSKDLGEAVSALFERRTPHFKGH